jgi:hypothetical protein
VTPILSPSTPASLSARRLQENWPGVMARVTAPVSSPWPVLGYPQAELKKGTALLHKLKETFRSGRWIK